MTFRFVTAFILIALLPLSAFGQPQGPKETVQQATDQLLEKLVEVQPLYEEDPEVFFAEVEKSLAPFIDFDGFARGVMAKYYRRASDEQRAAFTEKFETELIQTYSKALVGFDNQKIEVMPLEAPPERGRATVQLNVHGKDGAIYPVVYTMAEVDGAWKLRNVVIEGINIGLQFRSQFGSYMQKYRNDIDEVIANWNVDVESS
jgi:phospholipid transport system substrate-binding protein